MLPFDLDGIRWHIPTDAVGVGEPASDYPLLTPILSGGEVYRCPKCKATWVADQPERCGWCYRRWIAQQRAQRTLDLMPPEWDHHMTGWLERLRIAVAADRITADEALRAIERHVDGRRPQGNAS